MNLFRFLLLFLVSATLATGCRDDKSPVPVKNESGSLGSLSIPTAAQPKLPTMKLLVGDQELITEIASKPDQLQTGMMFRTNMAENEGMLFIFGHPTQASFWMKNTLIPLSCAYIDPDGVIQELHDMKPQDLSPIMAGSENIQFVLEVNQGWFKRHNIVPGTLIGTERGSLQETFFQRR